MWWMLLVTLTIIVASIVVARRWGPHMTDTRGSTTVNDSEHMIGVEMSRHNDSGSMGGNAP